MEGKKEEKVYIVNQQAMDAAVQYLTARPYIEVMHIMQVLTGSALMSKDEVETALKALAKEKELPEADKEAVLSDKKAVKRPKPMIKKG